jgi:quinol monooxygenase YgiN
MSVAQPVAVSVRLTSHPGCESQVAEEVRNIAKRVREEPICLSIVTHRDPDDPHRFFIFEQFRDRREFEEFRTTCDYMQAYFSRMEPLVSSFEFGVWIADAVDASTRP